MNFDTILRAVVVANELAKFYELKEKEIISQKEFDMKKKPALGLIG